MNQVQKTSSTTDPTGNQRPAATKNVWIMRGMILAGVVMMVVAVAGMLLTNKAQGGGSAGTPVSGPIREGIRLADFTAQDVNGQTVHLSDYAGKVVLVNAWATWCPPCQAEMPALNSFYYQHKGQGFVILAIDAGEEPSLPANFAKTNSLLFPILVDPNERLMDQFNIHDYPTSFLVGKDGVIKVVHIGMFTPGSLDQEILPYIQQ